MRNEIEKAIRETLVVLNKVSIGRAVDKIMAVVDQKQTCSIIQEPEDIFGVMVDVNVTSCCKTGPITDENYCPVCGSKIVRS